MKKVILILSIFFLITGCSKINIFGFGEETNKFEKLKINEYLWLASKDLFKNNADINENLSEGNIITGWITSKKNPNTRFRISIYIMGSKLIEENIKIFTEKEVNKSGVWQRQQASRAFNANLKIKIMEKALRLEESYQ